MKKLLTGILLMSANSLSGNPSQPEIHKIWNYQKPLETRQEFKEILQNQSNKSSQYSLEIITQIARTHSLRGEFKEAFQTLEAVKTALRSSPPTVQARYYLELGRTYNSSGDKEQATANFLLAIQSAKQIKGDDYLLVDAYHMAAIAAKDFEQKQKWTLQGIGLAEQSANPRTKNWLGAFYNNLGWDLFDLKNYQEASTWFEKSLKFHQSISKNPQRIHIAKWTIARAKRALNKWNEALAIQNSLKEEMEKRQEPDAYVYEELGEIYLALKKSSESKLNFKRAYELLVKDKWFKKNATERLQRIERLSQ